MNLEQCHHQHQIASKLTNAYWNVASGGVGVNTSPTVRKVPSWLNKLDGLKSVRVVNNQKQKPLNWPEQADTDFVVIRGIGQMHYLNVTLGLKISKPSTCGHKAPADSIVCFFCLQEAQSLILKGNFITLNNYTFPCKSLDRPSICLPIKSKLCRSSIGESYRSYKTRVQLQWCRNNQTDWADS